MVKYNKVKAVTLETKKTVIDVPNIVKICGIQYKDQLDEKSGEIVKDCLPIAEVFCHEAKDTFHMVLNYVLIKQLNEVYPDNTFIGKSFEIIKLKKGNGKRYHPFVINEIEVEEVKK